MSFVHEGGVGYRVDHDGDAWRVESGQTLDEWLAERGAPEITKRLPTLAYGSNACPSKITWLRENLGLRGPVVVLRVTCHGLAAVWAAGLRVVDDQRAATLAAAPGVTEDHSVWLATAEQVAVLDRCEGRGVRYDLVRLRTGRVVLETGDEVERPLAYVGHSELRMPLLVDGQLQRCVVVPQDRARALVGTAADSDGLVRDVLPTPSP